MSFKERTGADADRVFLNTDEFAENHVVEGHPVICVLASDVMNQGAGAEAFSLFGADMTLMAKTCDMPKRRGPGQSLNVDGIGYTVRSWEEACGMTTVLLSVPG